MKEKVNVAVGDIVSFTSNRLVKSEGKTSIQPYTEEGEVVEKFKAQVTVLVGKGRKMWDIKDLKLITLSEERDFSKITLTPNTVLNFGSSYKGLLLKDVPAFYLKNLIDNQYIIPDNLNTYISENWDNILEKLQKENEEYTFKKAIKYGTEHREEILKEHEIDLKDEDYI